MAFPTASSHKAKSPQLCRPQFPSSRSTAQAFPVFSSVSLSYRRQTLAQMLRQNFRPELLNAGLAWRDRYFSNKELEEFHRHCGLAGQKSQSEALYVQGSPPPFYSTPAVRGGERSKS